jgi:hypothetical protein
MDHKVASVDELGDVSNSPLKPEGRKLSLLNMTPDFSEDTGKPRSQTSISPSQKKVSFTSDIFTYVSI